MKADQLIRQIEIRDRRGQVIGTKEVVTYQGLLSKAHDEGLKSIRTNLVQVPTDDNGRTAIAKAEVETSKGFFEAIGDASPENVNSFIVPHLIRMAETRAKARALRDAVNIGVVSFEELDGEQAATESLGAGSGASPRTPARPNRNADSQRPSPPPRRQPDNGTPAPMSEAQRRYLFRILAGQGLAGDAAHEYLKELFGVDSLAAVGKNDATAMIDRLLNGAEEVPQGIRPLFASARALLEAYLAGGPPQDPEAPLFPGRNGQPLGKRRIQELFARYARAAELPDGATCHSLRHAIATHLLDAGESLEFVKEHLGHRKIENTALYARVSNPARERAFARLEKSPAIVHPQVSAAPSSSSGVHPREGGPP